MAEDQTQALLELLYHVSREVAAALDLRTVLQRVLYAATQNVGGERGSIVVLDNSGKPVDATIVFGKRFHEHTAQQLRETVERGLAGWVVRNRKAALIPDTSRDKRWLRRPDDSPEQTGAKSAICAPLLAHERLVGVLTLVHPAPNTFQPQHLELMQAIADQVGIAVLNARLYTESQRQARLMSALAESAGAINASLKLDGVLQCILDQTIHALQVETAALALSEASTDDLVFRAVSGQGADSVLGQRLPSGQGLIGRVVRQGRGLIVPDVSAEADFTDGDRLGGLDIRAVAVAPIQTQDGAIGILEAINPLSGTFDLDALQVTTGLGSLAGTAIQNAQLFERLRAAHLRYRELFEDSIDPILITDPEGKILEANRRSEMLSGYAQDRLRSLSIDQLHEVDWGKTGLGFENLRKESTSHYESRLHCQDGEVLPVEVYVRRVQFEQLESLQWTLRDIREREALDELREDLAATIYHDLRSPLANIFSSLELLDVVLTDPRDAALQSILEIMTNSTNRIQRLVSSLLDINRLESGQKIVNQQSMDPAELIREALKDVAPLADGRQQTIVTKLRAGLPPVWVDVDMIRRVLVNLLENAIKYTPVDSRIEVGARRDRKWLRFWVKDAGPGIPPEDQEKVFDKFFRLRSQDSSMGLGVGLAFCRLAVQGHGGRIWVESEVEKGTQFIFTVPLAKPEQVA